MRFRWLTPPANFRRASAAGGGPVFKRVWNSEQSAAGRPGLLPADVVEVESDGLAGAGEGPDKAGLDAREILRADVDFVACPFLAQRHFLELAFAGVGEFLRRGERPNSKPTASPPFSPRALKVSFFAPVRSSPRRGSSRFVGPSFRWRRGKWGRECDSPHRAAMTRKFPAAKSVGQPGRLSHNDSRDGCLTPRGGAPLFRRQRVLFQDLLDHVKVLPVFGLFAERGDGFGLY